MRGILVLVAVVALWAGPTMSATTITFDGRPPLATRTGGGFVEEGLFIHSKAWATVLTSQADAAIIGSFTTRVSGGGSFRPLSLDVRILGQSAKPAPTTFAVAYWDLSDGVHYAGWTLPTSAFDDFVTLDLSSLGPVIQLGMGYPAARGRQGIWGNGPFTLVDNITFDDLVLDPSLAVPEPSTWAMIIIGFGLLGGRFRVARRGAASVSAA